MVGSNLLRYNNTQPFCLFDMETEGLNLSASRPWQICWAKFTLKEDIELVNEYILWPDLNVSDQAAKVTGFNRAQYLDTAKPAKDVLGRFTDEVLKNKNLALVGHNLLGFDVYMIQSWRKALGLPVDWSFMASNQIYDTLAMSKALKMGWIIPDGNIERLMMFYRCINTRLDKKVKTNLSAMCKHFDIPYDSSKMHNAAVDVEKNVEVFRKLVIAIDV